jgi:uncharacterized protein YecT (DUF1311 family)
MKTLFYLFLLISVPLKAQTLQSLKQEAIAYQHCLDKGEDMKGCAEDYYTLADKHLNSVYTKLLAKLGKNEKQQLKQEQRKWLKTRDAAFEKIQRDANKLFGCDYICNDYKMTVAGEKADFVLERVKVLIKRLEKLKQ